MTYSAVGILLCIKKFFAKTLLPSSRAAARSGPDDLSARARETRPPRPPPAEPPARPPSDPLHISAASESNPSGEPSRTGTQVPIFAMPGFPGAAKTDDPGRLRQLPRQRVLAAAAAKNQYFHSIQ